MIRLEPLAPAEPGGPPAGGDDGEQVERTNLRRWVVRTLVLGVALALVAVAAGALLLAWGEKELARAVERFREVVGPLDGEAYRPAPVPDHANAAPRILETLERLENDVDPAARRELGRLRTALRRPARAWSEEEWRLAEELERSTRGALEPLQGIANRAGSDFGLDYSAGPDMELPNLFHALGTAGLLHARARLAWRDGRTADGAAAVEDLSALSRALENEALLLFQLMGNEVERTHYLALQDALATSPAGSLDPATLTRLHASAGERPRRETLRRVLGGEASLLYSLRPEARPGRAATFERFLPERLRYRWLTARIVADGLDYFARVAETAPLLAADGAEAWPEPPSPGSKTPLVTDLRPMFRRFQATESLRRSTRLALERAIAEAAPPGSDG